jgi:hypothetical protein
VSDVRGGWTTTTLASTSQHITFPRQLGDSSRLDVERESKGRDIKGLLVKTRAEQFKPRYRKSHGATRFHALEGAAEMGALGKAQSAYS